MAFLIIRQLPGSIQTGKLEFGGRERRRLSVPSCMKKGTPVGFLFSNAIRLREYCVSQKVCRITAITPIREFG